MVLHDSLLLQLPSESGLEETLRTADQCVSSVSLIDAINRFNLLHK